MQNYKIFIQNTAFYISSDQEFLSSNSIVVKEEDIEFSISFAQKSYVYNVVVFKVMNIQTLDQQKTYTLRCFSKLSYLSLFTKVSKHYTGTTSEMAFSIFKRNIAIIGLSKAFFMVIYAIIW